MDVRDVLLEEDEDPLFMQPLTNIQPYQFEPLKKCALETGCNATRNSDSESEIGDSDSDGNTDDQNSDTRMDNIAWCSCHNCATMETEDECLCCQEVGPVTEVMENTDIKCITDHEGFHGNCLNRFVLQVSVSEFVEQDGPLDDDEPIHELYRYIAYRRFTRWIWNHLGRRRRKVIPSCAVSKIRKAFPSETYAGFKYWRP